MSELLPPSDQPADVVINLGDPNVHSHEWLSTGVDENGLHTVECDCGESGVGYGDFAVKGA